MWNCTIIATLKRVESNACKMKLIRVTLVVLLGVGVAAAQRPLSFDEALRMMVERNGTVEAQRHAAMAAHRQRQAAIGLFFPRLSIEGTYLHLDKDVRIDLNSEKSALSQGAQSFLGTIASDPAFAPLVPKVEGALSSLLGADWTYTLQRRNTCFVGATLSLPIFTGGRIIAANRAAKAEEQLVAASSAKQMGELATTLVERYFGLAVARAVEALRASFVADVEEHLRQVNIMLRNGVAVQADKLYVEYRLAEARRELFDAQSTRRLAEQALTTLIVGEGSYLPTSSPFVVGTLETLDFFRSCALQQNPALEEVEQRRQLALQNKNMRRAAFFPEVAALATGTLWQHDLSPLVPRWMVGVSLNFNIFNGLSREYEYSSARHTLRRVEALQRQGERDVQLLVESLYEGLLNARHRLASLASSEAFAEEYLRTKRIAFTEGVATSIEVLDASLALCGVRVEQLNTAYRFDVALARLLASAGMADMFSAYMNHHTTSTIEYE